MALRMTYNIVVLLGLSASLAGIGYQAWEKFQPLRWIQRMIEKLPGIIIEWLMQLFQKIFRALKYLWKIISGIGGDIKRAGENVIRELNRALTRLLNIITKGANKAIDDVAKGGKKAIKKIEKGGEKVINKISGAVTGVVNKISGAGKQIADDVSRAGEKIFNDIIAKVNEAIAALGNFADDAINEVKRLFDKAWNEIKETAEAAKNAAAKAAKEAAEAAEAAYEATKKAFKDIGGSMERGFNEAGKAIVKVFSPGGGCFNENTPIKLVDGNTVKIKNINLEDTLISGSTVRAIMQIKSYVEDPFYKIYSEELGEDVFVTGSHHIKWGDKYIPVREFEKAEKLDTVDDVLYCLVTSDHMIPVGEFTFWDWEDNLIPKA